MEMNLGADKDALVASQIAYMNIKKEYIKRSIDAYGLATLENIFQVSEDDVKKGYIKDDIKKEYIKRVYGGRDPETTELNEYEQMRLEDAKAFIEEIKNSKYAQWEIVEVKDDNTGSGFYGCMIDCGEGKAMLGFRGSESFNTHQLRQDWVNADVGLFNNTLTEQQDVAQKFVKDMNRKYGAKYTVFDFSGHSLGGNLSQHAGITVPASMQGKVGTIFNLDGPGYSDEYLRAHSLEILKMSSHVKHYQWSVIGTLLNQMPGETFQSIRTDDRVYGINDLDEGTGSALFQKHDTGFVWHWLKENNIEYFQKGEMDGFARFVSGLIRNLENENQFMVSNLVAGIALAANLILLARESENMKEFGDKFGEFLKDMFKNKLHGVTEYWNGIERGISKWLAEESDFIALYKNPYFMQVTELKKKAGRISSPRNERKIVESDLTSFKNIMKTYEQLEEMMKMYKEILLETAEKYRKAGEKMVLEEQRIS